MAGGSRPRRGTGRQRVTPAMRLNDGVNFHPTNKYVLFGHHFAAIAGAGPLLGPVLAAQFGFLARVSLAGDRRGVGRGSAGLHHPGCVDAAEWPVLPEIARDELGLVTGTATAVAVLFIVVVALAGLGFAVVNALYQQCLGYLHDCDDDSHRLHHGILSSEVSAWSGGGSLSARCGAVGCGCDLRAGGRPVFGGRLV